MLKSDVRYGEVIGHIKDKKLVKYANDTKKLLSVTIETKQGDRIDTVVFGTKKQPQKPAEIDGEIRVGDYVLAKGSLSERESKSKDGQRTYRNYSLSVSYYKHLDEENNQSGTSFTLSGVIQKRKGNNLTILSKDRYKNAQGEEVTYENELVVTFDEERTQCVDFDDLVPKTKVSIVGAILNRVESTVVSTDEHRLEAMGDAGKKRSGGKVRVELLAATIKSLGEEEDESLDELDEEYIPF